MLDLSTNQQYLNKKPILDMTSWMKNQIANIYNFVSASVGAIQDELVERRQSVCETASLLYNRMMDNIDYGQDWNTPQKKKQRKKKKLQNKKKNRQKGTLIQKQQIIKGPWNELIAASWHLGYWNLTSIAMLMLIEPNHLSRL